MIGLKSFLHFHSLKSCCAFKKCSLQFGDFNIQFTRQCEIQYGLSEASLSGVEPLMQKIHSEIRRVDAGILAAVRQQVVLFAY